MSKMLSSCVGLFWFSDLPRSTGSGVLVEFEGRHFIATCSHCNRRPPEYPTAMLVVYYGQTEITEDDHYGFIAGISSMAVEEEEDSTDVACILLKDDGVAKLRERGLHFVPLPEAVRSIPLETSPCFIAGYPGDDMSEDAVKEHKTIVVTLDFTARVVEARYSGEGGNEGRLRFDKIGDVWPELHHSPLSVSGMSGGGVWQADLTEDKGQWTFLKPRLIGLLQAQSKRGGYRPYLIAEKIDVWMDQIRGLMSNDADPGID